MHWNQRLAALLRPASFGSEPLPRMSHMFYMFHLMDVQCRSGNGALGLCLLALAQNCYVAASLVVPRRCAAVICCGVWCSEAASNSSVGRTFGPWCFEGVPGNAETARGSWVVFLDLVFFPINPELVKE